MLVPLFKMMLLKNEVLLGSFHKDTKAFSIIIPTRTRPEARQRRTERQKGVECRPQKWKWLIGEH
jgi:hypothetical protein